MGRIRRIRFSALAAGVCIAEVILNQGYQVSGSDIAESTVTQHLQNKGAEIFNSHDALWIKVQMLLSCLLRLMKTLRYRPPEPR